MDIIRTCPRWPPCNIEARSGSKRFRRWHVTCCIKRAKPKQRARLCAPLAATSGGGTGPGGVQAPRGKANGQGDTDGQQQELFLVVAARLAADQVLRPGVRPNDDSARVT